MKRMFIICLFLISFMPLLSQNDSVFLNEYKGIMISQDTLLGYDSLGRKQGLWKEKNEQFMVFYDYGNGLMLDNSYSFGYYINGKKEGTWEVASDEFENKLILYAHCYYMGDSLIYTVFYDKYRIKSILRYSYLSTPNNLGYYKDLGIEELIVFNKKGKLKAWYQKNQYKFDINYFTKKQWFALYPYYYTNKKKRQ